jgi:hypothetical protein
MSHSADVKVSLALAIEALLTQIAMPALENERKESELIFPGQVSHKDATGMNTCAAILASGKRCEVLDKMRSAKHAKHTKMK